MWWGGRERHKLLKLKKKKLFGNFPQSTVEMLRTSPFFGVGEGRWYLRQFSRKYPYTQLSPLRSRIDAALGSGYKSGGQLSPPYVHNQKRAKEFYPSSHNFQPDDCRPKCLQTQGISRDVQKRKKCAQSNHFHPCSIGESAI